MPLSVIAFVTLITLISFVFGGLAIKWHNDFKLSRERIRAGGGGSSLSTSELRGLIQEAMLDAVAPMEERLDLIEMHLRQLPEHAAEPAALELPEPIDPSEQDEAKLMADDRHRRSAARRTH